MVSVHLTGMCGAGDGILQSGMALFRIVFRPLYVWARGVVEHLLFEVRLGTHTTGGVELEEFHLEGKDRLGYWPSGWLVLPSILRPDEVSERDVFADLGSGKGRVLVQAASYPFRRVIGVELSEQLNDIARANVHRALPETRASHVFCVRSDVTDWEIPDDLTVVYMYNPFRGTTFASVVQRLIRSVDRNPRRVRIIYHVPREEAYLIGTGRIRLLRTARRWRPTREWSDSTAVSMYELL